ncbi:MAG TPA: hypothetical protein VFL93_16685 [Longimicrobiaceae bacterium]|nr:hypothetical protein [Longimicrobiaceae bacterium]
MEIRLFLQRSNVWTRERARNELDAPVHAENGAATLASRPDALVLGAQASLYVAAGLAAIGTLTSWLR